MSRPKLTSLLRCRSSPLLWKLTIHFLERFPAVTVLDLAAEAMVSRPVPSAEMLVADLPRSLQGFPPSRQLSSLASHPGWCFRFLAGERGSLSITPSLSALSPSS